jgi:hypothetical protein
MLRLLFTVEQSVCKFRLISDIADVNDKYHVEVAARHGVITRDFSHSTPTKPARSAGLVASAPTSPAREQPPRDFPRSRSC